MNPTVQAALRTLRQSDIGALIGSCGRRLYLSKVLRVPLPGSRKTRQGTAFHRGVEHVYRTIQMGDRLDLSESIRYAIENLETSFSLAPVEELDLAEEESVADAIAAGSALVQGALVHYLEQVFPAIAEEGEPRGVELPVALEHRGFTIRGTVDLVDGTGFVRDHKLTSEYLPSAMPLAYLSQLSRYVWMLETSGVVPEVTGVRLDMVSTARAALKKKPRIESASLDQTSHGLSLEDLRRLGRDSINQALDMIEAGIYPRTAMNAWGSFACGNCPFKGSVCAGELPLPECPGGSAAA